jgi:hypothetical protein
VPTDESNSFGKRSQVNTIHTIMMPMYLKALTISAFTARNKQKVILQSMDIILIILCNELNTNQDILGLSSRSITRRSIQRSLSNMCKFPIDNHSPRAFSSGFVMVTAAARCKNGYRIP